MTNIFGCEYDKRVGQKKVMLAEVPISLKGVSMKKMRSTEEYQPDSKKIAMKLDSLSGILRLRKKRTVRSTLMGIRSRYSFAETM